MSTHTHLPTKGKIYNNEKYIYIYLQTEMNVTFISNGQRFVRLY